MTQMKRGTKGCDQNNLCFVLLNLLLIFYLVWKGNFAQFHYDHRSDRNYFDGYEKRKQQVITKSDAQSI